MFDGITLITYAKNLVHHLATWPPENPQERAPTVPGHIQHSQADFQDVIEYIKCNLRMTTLFRKINFSLNRYQLALDFSASKFFKIDYLKSLVFNHLKARNSS